MTGETRIGSCLRVGENLIQHGLRARVLSAWCLGSDAVPQSIRLTEARLNFIGGEAALDIRLIRSMITRVDADTFTQ